MSIRVCILALPTVLGSAVCGPMDVLGTANVLAGETLFAISVRTPGKGPLETSYGLALGATPGLPRTPQHVVLVPGFGVTRGDRAVEQVTTEVERHPRVCRWLRRQAEAGAIVAGNCVGTFMLAEAGLLDERAATTTWWLKDLFASRYPRVHLDARALVTASDSVLTAGAAMAHLDLALHLVDRFGGATLARACAKVLVLDQGRRSQAAYAIPEFARARDEVVQTVAALLKAELADAPSVATLAQRVGVTPRTLNRRFKRALGCTPLEYRSRLRIDEARRLLERSTDPVDAIAHAVGYADSSAFYRAFTRAVGMSPRDYQQRFSIAG